MNKGKGKDHKLKLLAAYYKPYKGLFFADLFFAILGAAVTLVIPLLVRYIMTSIGAMPVAQAQKTILYIGLGMLALILVQLGSRYFITYYGHMMGAYIEHDMRNEIFSHYQKLSFAFYDNQKVGHLLSRITSDLFDISELLHHVTGGYYYFRDQIVWCIDHFDECELENGTSLLPGCIGDAYLCSYI